MLLHSFLISVLFLLFTPFNSFIHADDSSSSTGTSPDIYPTRSGTLLMPPTSPTINNAVVSTPGKCNTVADSGRTFKTDAIEGAVGAGTNHFYTDIHDILRATSPRIRAPFARFDNVPIAIVIDGQKVSSGATPENQYGLAVTLFQPQMDVLSLLHVVNSSTTAFFDGAEFTRIRVEMPSTSALSYSESRRRSAAQCSIVVPFWTIIAHVDNGEITGFDFDDDCSTCGADNCVSEDYDTNSVIRTRGNCGVTYDQCTYTGLPNAVTDCDLKIYLVWDGTDRNGYRLTSAGRRLSTFRQWSLNAAYNAAAQFTQQNLPTPPSNIPTLPQNQPGVAN